MTTVRLGAMTTSKRPKFWTKKEDGIINALFNIVSTEKLSVLMNVSVSSIVQRKKYLENFKNGQSKPRITANNQSKVLQKKATIF